VWWEIYENFLLSVPEKEIVKQVNIWQICGYSYPYLPMVIVFFWGPKSVPNLYKGCSCC